ncbi:hypothetical protein HMPREF1246_1305 [Acidaminococcus sp. BV3L6]|nr:hypothetical protein HMPREF1246_1305 [Acidaminococcus sp. BV3L6]
MTLYYNKKMVFCEGRGAAVLQKTHLNKKSLTQKGSGAMQSA